MCLHPRPVDPVPEETVRVAGAGFPKGNTLMKMMHELGAIFGDEDFAELFPRRGQPAMAPWRLALVTIMQFAESLTVEYAGEPLSRYEVGVEPDTGKLRSVAGASLFENSRELNRPQRGSRTPLPGRVTGVFGSRYRNWSVHRGASQSSIA